ncbi:MAG: hypothetical protein PHV37_02800 [Candidatus Gastranaerophilales bacterium]|nr:hypothetical protein [Candidatus Gastranaerophilales bacterium]
MSNAFASAIFIARNTDKVKHGDIGRAPVILAQTGSLVDKVSKLDNSVGKTTKTALDAFEKSTSFGSKALNVAGKLVNPLLIGAAGIRVATSENKEATLYHEAGGMSAMFAAEKLMKSKTAKEIVRQKGDNLTEFALEKLGKNIKTIGNMSAKSKNKVMMATGFILSGLAFVGASMLGYDLGSKVGDSAYQKKHKNTENKSESLNTSQSANQTADKSNSVSTDYYNKRGRFTTES